MSVGLRAPIAQTRLKLEKNLAGLEELSEGRPKSAATYEAVRTFFRLGVMLWASTRQPIGKLLMPQQLGEHASPDNHPILGRQLLTQSDIFFVIGSISSRGSARPQIAGCPS